MHTQIGITVLRVAALLADELDEELQKVSGLGLSEILVILQVMFADGRLKMTDLADTLVVTRGGVTRIVDRLVKAGYIARVPSEEDRRVVYAEVTEAGRRLIADHQATFEAVTAKRVGEMLAAPQMDQMHEILHVLSCENPGWQPPNMVTDSLSA